VLAASLMMNAASTSERSANCYQTTQHNIPEGSYIQGKNRLGDRGEDGRTISIRILKKIDVNVETRLNWLVVDSNGSLL
jgi:hypothetical protein